LTLAALAGRGMSADKIGALYDLERGVVGEALDLERQLAGSAVAA